MSSEVIEKPLELPIFVVYGDNWVCYVEMNEVDFVLNGEDEIYDNEDKNGDCIVYNFDLVSVEAATKAIESMVGINEINDFELDEGAKEPIAGTVLYVHMLEDDFENGVYLPSFVCFANAGLYEQCLEHYLLFHKERKAAERAERKEAKAKAENKKLKEEKKNKEK